MRTFRAGPLRGEVRVAGDKSISHRALMLASLASGTSTIELPNRGADVLATRDAVSALGAEVDVKLGAELVRGRFAGLDREGALLLETATGPRKIVSGELLGHAA